MQMARRVLLIPALLISISTLSSQAGSEVDLRGMPVLGGEGTWQALVSQEDPETLYFHDRSVTQRKALVLAAGESRSLAGRLIVQSKGNQMPHLDFPDGIESAIDQTCEKIKADPKALPTFEEEVVYRQLFGSHPVDYRTALEEIRKAGIQHTLFAAGAVATEIEFPVQNSKPRIVSFVITCRDPAGRRLNNAQNRSTIDLTVMLSSKLLLKFTQNISAVRAGGKPAAIQAIESTTTRLMLKMMRLLIQQAQTSLRWYNSDEGVLAFRPNVAEDQRALAFSRGSAKKFIATMTPRLEKILKSAHKLDVEVPPTEVFTAADLKPFKFASP